MKPQTKKRLIIWSSVAVILGVGGFFAYKKIIKPKLDERKAKKAAEEAAKLAASTAAASTPSGTTTTSGSSSPTGKPTNNSPLYPDDVKKFQDWMDKNHPNWVGATNFMLNNGKNLYRGQGYGNFGNSTKKAYEYFGKEWKDSVLYQQAFPATPSATNVVTNWGFNPK